MLNNLLNILIAIILFVKLTDCDNYYTNECQNDWFNYNNKKCIKVWKESKVNYLNAINECKALNASLVSIESEEENLFLTSILYDLEPEVKGLFIGLIRKIQNNSYLNEFEWTDGSQLLYENWAPEEPSPWFEPCVEMYSVDINAGKWNDLSCNGHRYALCQQLINQNTSNEYKVGFELCEHLDYVRYRNNCYKAYDHYSAQDWATADRKCKSDHKNASLVYIEDSYEHSFIKYWTKSVLRTYEFWIGLMAKNNTQNLRYEWVSEWPVYYSAWDSGQPNFKPHSGNQCVIEDVETGLWRSNPFCSDKRAFVCKISDHRVIGDQSYTSAFCPVFVNKTSGALTDEWINLHKNLKHCHWFSEQISINWSNASKLCHKRNGSLVSIHSRHELELLKPFVQKYGRPLWIGLYQSPGGLYRWEDGSALDFQNWFPGEPTDEKQELCVEMRAQDMTWNDIQCSGREMQFICEINKIKTIETVIENKSNKTKPMTTTVNPITVNRSDDNNRQPLKGWSIAIIWIIVVIIFIAIIIIFATYLWSERISGYLAQNLNCLGFIFNRGSYSSSSSSGVNSQRSSVNERNVFDVSNIH